MLMFGWQINANFKRFQDLGDVYYGKEEASRENDDLQFQFSFARPIVSNF